MAEDLSTKHVHVHVAGRNGNAFFVFYLALEASSNDKLLEKYTHYARILKNKSTGGNTNLGGQPP